MPDDNVIDISLDKVKEVRQETKGFTKEISAARQEMERFGQAATREFQNVSRDFKNLGSSVKNNSLLQNVGHKLGGLFAPVQLGMSATPGMHASQMQDFYQMQAAGKAATYAGTSLQNYSRQMVWSQAARGQGLAGSNLSTRQAAVTGQRLLTAGVESKELATQAQALKQISAESRAAAKGLEMVGKAGKTVGGFLDFSALRTYTIGLESLGKTGTKTGAVLAKAFGPAKFIFNPYIAAITITTTKLGELIEKSREVEAELTQRNRAISRLLGVSSTEAGSTVRRYAQTTGMTQYQAQESVGRLAQRGFRDSEMESVARQVEYTMRRQGLSREDAFSQRTTQLERGLVGLSGAARERAFREMAVTSGGLDSGPMIRALDPKITQERAHRLMGNTPSIWEGFKERVAYDVFGSDPFQEGIVTRAGRGLSRAREDLGNLGTYIDPINAGKQTVRKAQEGLGWGFRTLSRNRASTRAGQMDYSPWTVENYSMEQRATVKHASLEKFYTIRMQEEEEKLAESKGKTGQIKRAQEARKVVRERMAASQKIAIAESKLRRAESTGNETVAKAAREELGMAMQQADRSQKAIDSMNLSVEEQAYFQYASENEGGDLALEGMKLTAEAQEQAQKEEAKRMKKLRNDAQIAQGTRLSEAGEKKAMEKYTKDYDLKKETTRMQEAEQKIVGLTAEKEKYESLSERATGKEKTALERKISELTTAINKNAKVYQEASKNVEKLVGTVLKEVAPQLQRRGIKLMETGLAASKESLAAQGYMTDEDRKLLFTMEQAGLNNPKIAKEYEKALSQVQRRSQIKMQEIDNRYMKRGRQVSGRQMGVGVQAMAARGLISEGVMNRVQGLIDSQDPFDRHEAAKIMDLEQRKAQTRMQSMDNEFIGQERDFRRQQLGTSAEMLAAQGIITGEDDKTPGQLSVIQGLLGKKDPYATHRASRQIEMAQNKYQTMMGQVGLASYKFRKEADIGSAGMRIAGAQRRGIETSDIASDLTSEVDLVRNKANEILEIRKSAYEKEVEFTRNYTQMRMDVIQTHYDNATRLEQSRIEGADRRQAGGLQMGRELYGANQRMLGVVRQGWGFQDQRIQEYRQGRSFDENRLAAYGIQTPEAIQRARGIRDFREAERDFKRQKTRRRIMERGQYEAAQGALGEMESAGFDKERLMQSEGGVALLLQAESDSRAYYERQGEGGESQNRQMALIRKQKEFARQRFMAGEKMKQYQRASMDEQLALAESAVQESAAKGAGEGEGDARLRADYARKLGQAAQLAGEQGRTEDMERLMAKQEKIMEALPEEYKRDFADVQAQMNKHMEVAAKELTAIKGYWEKFFGITEEEKKDEGPKVAAKPEDVEGDGTSPAKGGLIGKIKQTLETVASAVTESANATQEAYRKGMTIHIDLNGEGASATTTNGAYNQ